MNAPFVIKAARSVDELQQFFTDLCDNRAGLYHEEILTLHEAVDELQAFAALSGLVVAIGQDKVQEIIGGSPPLVPEPADAGEDETHLRAANLVKQWELDDSRDRWRHTGELRPVAQSDRSPRREPYAPAQSTIDAFFYLARQQDADRLSGWLSARPMDAPALYKIWKGSRC